MASAWGDAWGEAWGEAWGATALPDEPFLIDGTEWKVLQSRAVTRRDLRAGAPEMDLGGWAYGEDLGVIVGWEVEFAPVARSSMVALEDRLCEFGTVQIGGYIPGGTVTSRAQDVRRVQHASYEHLGLSVRFVEDEP